MTELMGLAFTIFVTSSFGIFFTVDAMRKIAQSSTNFRSGYTQVMAERLIQIFRTQTIGTVIFYVVPLLYMMLFMFIG
ncbi:hypothetical protein PMAYCL1PPCAC_26149, partial [Pristionchus mayeri]